MFKPASQALCVCCGNAMMGRAESAGAAASGASGVVRAADTPAMPDPVTSTLTPNLVFSIRCGEIGAHKASGAVRWPVFNRN